MDFSVHGLISNWIPRENQSVTSTVALKAFLTDRLASNAEKRTEDCKPSQWHSQGRVVARAQVGQGCMHYRNKLFLKKNFYN